MTAYNTIKRLDQLSRWVDFVLMRDFSLKEKMMSSKQQLKVVGQDAGFRRYYRIETPVGTFIAVDAPPETEDTRSFVQIAASWKAGGIQVPAVFAVDYEQGFMLQEDLGDTLLFSVLIKKDLSEAHLVQYYRGVLNTLLDIQRQPTDALALYDDKLVQFELSQYTDWFLKQLMGFKKELEDIGAELSDLFGLLSEVMAQQPQGMVHRDYHSRNLMLQPDGSIAVIDFQGALCGPLLYDVVSVLKDCYICWPTQQVDLLLNDFIKEHPVLAGVNSDQMKMWFDLAGLQRHLKCLGIFSRLWLRDSRIGYLKDIPRTLNYVLSVCRKYPACEMHGLWLEKHVIPLLKDRLMDVAEGVLA